MPKDTIPGIWIYFLGSWKIWTYPETVIGDSSTRLFGDHHRRDDGLEEMIIQMYSSGVSTCSLADLLEKIYGTEYSCVTASRITDITRDEVEEWKNREIESDYFVLHGGAFVVCMKWDSVGKEAI